MRRFTVILDLETDATQAEVLARSTWWWNQRFHGPTCCGAWCAKNVKVRHAKLAKRPRDKKRA